MSRGDLADAMRRVLDSLDEAALETWSVRFGGGSRIALDLGGHRVSTDLDFLCSSADAYAELRIAIREKGYRALFRDTDAITLPREPRVDAYGVRFPVQVASRTLPFEIVREARIELGPAEHPGWTKVPCLSISDCFAEKLLANSDRWADPDSLSRDLVDLAILREERGAIPQAAWEAASHAYKQAARGDLIKALRRFEDEEVQRRAFRGLQIAEPARVLAGIDLLRTDLGL
jgi:hypothetical protein